MRSPLPPAALLLALAASACATVARRQQATAVPQSTEEPATAAPPARAAPSAPQRRTAAPRATAATGGTGLSLAVVPASAEILVDGEPRGTVADLPNGAFALPPGIYQVSLRAPGFVTWRAEVAVRTGRERIVVRLARDEEGSR